jgi:soluble lytic murein transglycosylase
MNAKYVYFVLLVLAFLFQNFTFKGLTKMNLKEVNEEVRVLHAKELLGKYYKSSSVSQTEGLQYLNVHLLNKVQASLPKKFLKKAPQITQMIISQAQKHDFDPAFVMAIIKTESNFNPLAIGGVGEIGLMQIRPETAAWIANKEKIKWNGPKTLKDPVQNVKIGVAYMAFLRDLFEGKAYKYLSAYNMGPNKLKKLIGNDSMPRKYSTKVMTHYEEFYNTIAIFNKPANMASNQISDVYLN